MGETASPLASRMAGERRECASSWIFEKEGFALTRMVARRRKLGIFTENLILRRESCELINSR